MITSNVLNRIFFIRSEKYATAFSIDVDGKQYLVTARHVIGSDIEKTGIDFFFNNSWVHLPVTLIGAGKGEIDVAVLAVNTRLSPSFPMEPTSEGVVIGQDVFFVGYPYKMWTDAGPAMAGRPFPFIKKGTLSSAFHTGDGIQRLFIDAINNEGFSGGPVVFTKQGSPDFRVAGIVSNFKIEYEPVLDENYEQTNMKVAYNTGFLVAYDIKYALDLIRSNPQGLPVA